VTDWPACVVCGEPVELDDVSKQRRRAIEAAMARDLGLTSYRVPDDVHTGHCLHQLDFKRAREAIQQSSVPDVTPPR